MKNYKNIKKVSSQKFEVRKTMSINGKRISRYKTVGSLSNAKYYLREIERELARLSNECNLKTWLQVKSQFLEYKKAQVTHTTFMNYQSALLKHTKAWDNLKVKDIKVSHCFEVIKNNDLSNETKKSLKKYINGVFKFSLMKNYIQYNPNSEIKLKSTKKNKLSAMNRDEIEKLLTFVEQDNFEWFSIFRITYALGLRSGEAIALKWEDINLSTQKAHIQRVYKPKEKSYFDMTKNGSDRPVSIDSSLIEHLKKIQSSANSEFVLPQLRPLMQGKATEILRSYQRKLGIKETNFHSLRASFITHLLLENVSVPKVMQLVGHKCIKTTQRYVRLCGSELNGSTEVLAIK